MRINKIRLQEKYPAMSGSESFELPSCDLALDSSAGKNGYFCKDVQGLGPPQLSSVVEGFDSAGVPIYGNYAQPREILLRIALKPGIGQSFSSLRDGLYKYLSRAVRLSFFNDALEQARTYGYIREIDTVSFSNQPEIQITVLCDDAELQAALPTYIPVPSLDTADPVINYVGGTAPTGIDLVMSVIANHSNLTISDHAQAWHGGPATVDNNFTVTYAFLTGDDILISTNPKTKYIRLVRGGNTYDLAGFLNTGAVWPRLMPGVNVWNWTILDSWITIDSASYYARYWGV